jgi:hypothetical protein
MALSPPFSDDIENGISTQASNVEDETTTVSTTTPIAGNSNKH